MATRTSPWPTGVPCWADMSVPDVDAARAFYAAVLGWAFDDLGPDVGNYVIATMDGHAVAALGPMQSPDQPKAWLLYLASDDADATAEAIAANGGTILLAPDDAGPYGRLLVAMDPTGAVFAVWQGKDSLGAELVNEPGGITWEDLRSTDPAAARTFYSAVFGVESRAVEMAPEDYQTFHLAGDDAPLGGIGGFMGPPEESHWVIYFAVASTDAAVSAAEQAGGSIVTAAFDSPFGRMAGIADPEGAYFQVVELPE